MHGVNHNDGVGNTAGTLLTNGVHVLVWTMAWTLGMGIVMLLRAGRIVSTWCTKHTNYPPIALILRKILHNERIREAIAASSLSVSPFVSLTYQNVKLINYLLRADTW